MKSSQLQKMFNGMLILGCSIVVTTMLSVVNHDRRHPTANSLSNTLVIESMPRRQNLEIEKQLSSIQQQLDNSVRNEQALLEANVASRKELQELRDQVRQLHSEMKESHNSLRSSRLVSEVKQRPPAKFAIAFVIGGVDPTNPTYLGYIYDVIAATHIMRKDGSKADVFVFFQMAYKSVWSALRDSDVELLEKMDIKFDYIPKHADESFNHINQEKFRLLTLTQYKRVLFMDGDVLPRRNIDYLAELSIAGVLKKNVVIAGRQEPANGGFFMISPREGAYERIQELIDQKNERGRKLPYPHWDPIVGWGHKFEEPDYWEKITAVRSTRWDFHGAFVDQGLLYHWVKYEEKSVSIFFNRHIQNWDVDEAGNSHLETTLHLRSTLSDYSKRITCWKGNMQGGLCRPPFSDYVHYTGVSKPWLREEVPEGLNEETAEESSTNFWFFSLQQANNENSLGIDFSDWKKRIGKRPLLGMYPRHSEVAKVLQNSDPENDTNAA